MGFLIEFIGYILIHVLAAVFGKPVERFIERFDLNKRLPLRAVEISLFEAGCFLCLVVILVVWFIPAFLLSPQASSAWLFPYGPIVAIIWVIVLTYGIAVWCAGSSTDEQGETDYKDSEQLRR